MTTAQEINQMVELLPEQDQNMICELVKKFVLAWDPDYTKLTAQEFAELQIAQDEIARGEYYSAKDIDWDNLEKYL